MLCAVYDIFFSSSIHISHSRVPHISMRIIVVEIWIYQLLFSVCDCVFIFKARSQLHIYRIAKGKLLCVLCLFRLLKSYSLNDTLSMNEERFAVLTFKKFHLLVLNMQPIENVWDSERIKNINYFYK